MSKMCVLKDDAAARFTESEQSGHLPESAAERRLRSVEGEIKAARFRIQVLEDTVDSLTSAGNDGRHPPRPGVDESVTEAITPVEGAEEPPAAEGFGNAPETAVPPPPSAPPTDTIPPMTKKRKKARKKKKKKTEKQGGAKVASWGAGSAVVKLAALLIPTVLFGQGLIKGDNAPLFQKKSLNHAMTSIGERLKVVFGSAEEKAAAEERIVEPTPSSLQKTEMLISTATGAGPQRRTQEATCPFCPEGMEVEPDSVIPDGGGFTCGEVETSAVSVTRNHCSQVQSAQTFCCPTSGALASADPFVPPVSSASMVASAYEQCPLPDTQVCGCKILGQSDYRGNISVTEDGAQCLHWDSGTIRLYGENFTEMFSDYEENYCRNPTSFGERANCLLDVPGFLAHNHYCDVPMCDPCSCVPACGDPNSAACGCPSFHQAENCCTDVTDEATCKCGYLKEACSKSLENNSTEFCALAEEACCEGNANPWCGCNMYQQICTENPLKFTCDFAAESCCNKFAGADSYVPRTENVVIDQGVNLVCECEFFTYVSDELGYDLHSLKTKEVCDATSYPLKKASLDQKILQANLALQTLYTEMHGDYWFRNDGWADAAAQCDNGEQWDVGDGYCNWYGVTCDDMALVTEVNLSKNNLTGNWHSFREFPDLVRIDISQNKVSGLLGKNSMFHLRQLEHLNISANTISGHADVLFLPSLKYAYFSQNKFTTAGFRRFHKSYHTLQHVDLSSNRIAQDINQIFLNIPPTLEKFDLSNNNIGGILPKEFPIKERVQFFAMSNNRIYGPLPDFPNTSPRIKHLDLANNGLTGTIHESLWQLSDLSMLDLAGNKFSGSIPSSIGDLTQLRTLRLSSNLLGQNIPAKLAKLKDVLQVLDLSSNALTGLIPFELGKLGGAVLLSGNPDLTNPAPLDLCVLEGFDSVNDIWLCPLERNVLFEFYTAARGQEWTVSEKWMSQYDNHCTWYGVACGEMNETVTLNLKSNGLSGTLSKSIAKLRSLSSLDLSDNEIKGTIPREIGSLSRLAHLRLSYNMFVGTMPAEFQRLSQLRFIQLNGNRLSGEIPLLVDTHIFPGDSSFIADCAVPSIYMTPLICDGCTMCCNSLDDCYPTAAQGIAKAGFGTYINFSWVLFLLTSGGCVVLHLVAFTRAQSPVLDPTAHAAAINTEKRYALDTLGRDSVYRFFFFNSLGGWGIALTVLALQLWMCFVFIGGSEYDFHDEKSDLVYTFKCPRDEEDCRDTSDLGLQGWILFTVLMVVHLLKDVVNGAKLIVLSGSARSPPHARLRFFFGGLCLITAALFTLYASTVYNQAIATNDTEIIENAVIILFISDIDEMALDTLESINSSWINDEEDDDQEEEEDREKGNDDNNEVVTQMKEELSQMESKHLEIKSENLELKGELKQVTSEVKTLCERIESMENERYPTFDRIDGARNAIWGV